ncbi:MAG: DUF3054 domain-containing protein [Acidimicrobiales bacterium]
MLDAAGLVAFVVIGRASHQHAESLPGIASTLWPFAAGAAIGWAVVARRAPASVPSGVVVCMATVIVGMALRVLAGQGTVPAFFGVATGFLGAVMVGGRATGKVVAERHRRASGALSGD